MAKSSEERSLPYGLRALLIIDDAAPRTVRADEKLADRTPHVKQCRSGHCPNKKKVA